MSPPAGFTDFYELDLQINYNNSVNPYLQYYAAPGTQPPQEQQAGWNERYLLYLSAPPSGSNLPIQNAYLLVQARASLLGLNYYIKKATCHQAGVFKSSWPMPNCASLPVFDSASVGENPPNNQLSSSPQESILIRQEASNLRRWEHQIRGIKDYLSDDAMTYFPATAYADAATFATTSVFDSLQTAIPPANFTGGTAATLTVTNTGGAISAPVIVNGGNYPGVVNGTYPCVFNSPSGQVQLATGTITITSGTVTAVAINASFQGAGYVGTNVTVPISNDPYGVPNYQATATYWSNFLSCLISFTGSGTIQRISASRYTAPLPSFPSGLVPAMVNTMVKVNRSLIQRVANRQTGKLRLTKPARVKRGI